MIKEKVFMKLAYVTQYNSIDIKYWSGNVYYIAQSLIENNILLEYIYPLKEKYSFFFKGKQHLYKHLFSKKYFRDREPVILKSYAQQIAKKLSGRNIDIVFSPGTIPIAYLDCKQPIVFWTDATFAGMIDFYPDWKNLSKETIKNGNIMEKLSLDRCKLAVYSSEWAAQTAINYYKINPSKIKVIPFGANIECNRNLDDIKEIINLRPSNKCKLLFLGVDWLRKGGDVALKVAEELNKSGLETELTIVGCKPIINKPLTNFVKTLGFISKKTKKGRSEINNLLAKSHFLILPSRAESFGIVFCVTNTLGAPPFIHHLVRCSLRSNSYDLWRSSLWRKSVVLWSYYILL